MSLNVNLHQGNLHAWVNRHERINRNQRNRDGAAAGFIMGADFRSGTLEELAKSIARGDRRFTTSTFPESVAFLVRAGCFLLSGSKAYARRTRGES